MGVGGHRGRSGSVAPPESRDLSSYAQEIGKGAENLWVTKFP